MSSIIEGNKRDPTFDLTKGDAVEIYLWSRHVTEQIAGTTIVTKNGPNSESRNSLGCWAMYANNCYISNPDDDDIVVTGKCIRVDQIPLNDMLHNAESLQSGFDYKPMHCYSTMVPSTVDGQPDELEKLTIFGTRIAADDPDMLIMHKQLTDFPFKLVPEAMQNIRKIMQTASKEEIAMDSLLEDPFSPIRTYQSIMTEMCNCIWSLPLIVNKNYRDLTEKSFKTRTQVVETAKKAEAIV